MQQKHKQHAQALMLKQLMQDGYYVQQVQVVAPAVFTTKF
jgi:hypothetical protein